MMYSAPVQEMLFCLKKFYLVNASLEVNLKTLIRVWSEILTEATKIGENVLAPINKADINPPVFQNEVRCGEKLKTPIWRYHLVAGLVYLEYEHGGMGLPSVLHVLMNIFKWMYGSIFKRTNDPGQIDALESHASDAIKKFLPKLNSGQWSGTMNLTEPQAGSDVGTLITELKSLLMELMKSVVENLYNIRDMIYVKMLSFWFGKIPGPLTGLKVFPFFSSKFLPKKWAALKRNNVSSLSMEKKLGLHGSLQWYLNIVGYWVVVETKSGAVCNVYHDE